MRLRRSGNFAEIFPGDPRSMICRDDIAPRDADVNYWFRSVRKVGGRGDAERKGKRVFRSPPNIRDRLFVEGIDQNLILKVEGLNCNEANGPSLLGVSIFCVACLWAEYLFEEQNGPRL